MTAFGKVSTHKYVDELVCIKGAKVNTEFFTEGGQATVGDVGQASYWA